MKKRESEFADIFCLMQEEYGNSALKNQYLKETDKPCAIFLREEVADCVEDLIEQLDFIDYDGGAFYIDAGVEMVSYEQVFLLDAQKICGIFLNTSCVRKFGSFQPCLTEEGFWEYLCRLTGENGQCRLYSLPSGSTDSQGQPSEDQADEKAFANAYVMRSHMNNLHKRNLLDSVFQQVCAKMQVQGCFQEFQEYMNLFMADSSQYEKIASWTAPFLVLRGDETCMGVLQRFSDDLAEALVNEGQAVTVVDGGFRYFEELQGRVYKGIVGFQTKALEIDFFQKLTGPKFQFWMDYPLHFKEILRDLPEEYHVLCQDADYAMLIRRFFHTPNAIQFPPGGIAQEWEEHERPYDIIFIGSYFRDEGEKLRGIQREFYEFMLLHPSLTFEQGYRKMVGLDEEEAGEEAFAEKMYELKPACRAVLGHFRERVLDKILDSGYSLHVYGKDWEKFRYKKPNLIVHSQVSVEESLRELQKAKIGLNIMSWHKSGMTERIANIMLSGAVCLSDETVFLREHMTDGEDILLFGLSELDRLPQMIDSVLNDDAKRQRIARKAYEKAINEFTWDVRARELIKFSENAINNNII